MPPSGTPKLGASLRRRGQTGSSYTMTLELSCAVKYANPPSMVIRSRTWFDARLSRQRFRRQALAFLEAGRLQLPSIGGQNFNHLGENAGIGGDHLPSIQIVAFTAQVTDQTARFHDQQASRGHIPRVEADLPESVV